MSIGPQNFKLSDHLEVTHENGEEHYRFRGKMPLDVMLRFLSQHFLVTKPENLSPEPIILALAWDGSRQRWVMNRSHIDDEDLERIFPEEENLSEMWSPRLDASIKAIKFYSPWRKDLRKARIPFAFVYGKAGTAPVITALDCSANEAAGFIHEVVALHVLGCQPHYKVSEFLSVFPVVGSEITAKKPPRLIMTSVEPAYPTWSNPEL